MKSCPTEPRACAFVTGAAAGIGRATARLFAGRGWLVGVADIDAAGLSALAAELGAEHVLALPLDVTSPQQWSAALDTFHRKTGRLDLLVNNAGILSSGPFVSTPLGRHHALVDVNIKGMINGCHIAKPYLAATPGARVINLSSASAIYGQASLATYSATKFAVRGLTEALNIEWQDDGIRVMDVMPLFVQTCMVKGMQARSFERMGARLTADEVAGVIWRAATFKGGFGKVHWAVGARAAWLHRLTGLSPDRINRFVARLIAA
jgi:NAD(P)-dependent dehydrogenase (short-subunit alcohol dehydrogenase family)